MSMQSPLYNFSIKTPRLTLKVPIEKEIEALGIVASQGIQKEEEPHFQDKHLYNKSASEITAWLQEFIDKHIREWNKEDWQLPFAIFYDEQPIGMITMYAKQFPIARGFGCGYWLGLAYQGKGFGTEMVQSILAFGFDSLNAREAYLGAWSDNTASLAIMEKLGFIPNGEYWMNRNGVSVKDKRMRLPKEQWSRQDTTSVEEFEQCKELFI